MAADPGRVEVVDCGLEVDDDPGARSVGQVEDLVDLFTLGDDPFVGADGPCQLDGVGVAVRRSVAGSADPSCLRTTEAWLSMRPVIVRLPGTRPDLLASLHLMPMCAIPSWWISVINVAAASR